MDPTFAEKGDLDLLVVREGSCLLLVLNLGRLDALHILCLERSRLLLFELAPWQSLS